MISNSKIIIAGDSWGLGEWSGLELGSGGSINHTGMAQYFTDFQYTVVNLSKGGSSNLESIERLKHYNISDNDIVLFIMTDPLRDLGAFKLSKQNNDKENLKKITEKITKALVDAQGVYPLLCKLMHNLFDELNQIGHPINLIGGLCNINTDISSQYNNLTTLIPSWINILVGQMPEYEHTINKNFVITTGSLLQHINLSEFDSRLAELIINDLHDIEKNFLVFREDIFHPDGVHPNRHGHRIAFDKIVESLKIDNKIK